MPNKSERKCRKCGSPIIYGYIFELCQPCFEAFEAKTEEAAKAGRKYRPTDQEIEAMNEPFVRRPC